MPCPYAGILGEPGKGVHERRIFGMSLNDWLMTIVAAYLTGLYFDVNFFLSLIVWFVVGEILHYVLGAQTAFLKMIGLTPHCD